MMRELRDVLNEGFAAHSGALAEVGIVDALTVRALASARRRRAWRAVAVGGVSVAAVSALAVAAMALPGSSDPHPVAPASFAFATPVPGAPAWCDLSTYPLPNLAAWGPARFLDRIYANYDTGEYVYVGRDGSHTVLEPSADGTVSGTVDGRTVYVTGTGPDGPNAAEFGWSRMAFDEGVSGGGGTKLGGGADPLLGYEWTTVAEQPVPAEINLALLAEVHTMSIGTMGTGLEPEVAGADAVVETVARYADGTEEVSRIHRGEPGASIKDYTGLLSVSTRVTLPSGQVYEITSTYDPSMTYAAACLGQGTASAAPATSRPIPTAGTGTAEAFHYGPYLTGPELALFQCSAALPEGLDAKTASAKFLTGSQYDPEVGMEVDFGDGGYAVHTADHVFASPNPTTPSFPGWGGQSGTNGIDPATYGAVTYDALVWVDGGDHIVARQSEADPALDTARLEGAGNSGSVAYGNLVDGTQGRTWWTGPVKGTAVACDGVDQTTVDAATPVVIHGYGHDTAAMTWEIIRP
jgi:hypothetical protein